MAKNKSIYLAGGFKSGWQKAVIKVLKEWHIFDPSSHNLPEPSDYTKWDLNAIERSDVLLAYMEKDNPGGYALSLEVGYAKALGKLIVLIEEHPDEQRYRYFEIIREVADLRFDTVDEAIDYLAPLSI